MTAITQKVPSHTDTTTHGTWLETMGALFRKRLHSEADIFDLVESGIPGGTFIGVSEILRLPKGTIGAETTIRNRLKKGSGRLSAEETERLLRIGRVFALACELFDSESQVVEWLHTPARYLHDKPPIAPIDLAHQDAGVRLLEEKLQRTAHGMF